MRAFNCFEFTYPQILYFVFCTVPVPAHLCRWYRTGTGTFARIVLIVIENAYIFICFLFNYRYKVANRKLGGTVYRTYRTVRYRCLLFVKF